MCGEKCGYRLPFRSIVGSPPRVRGKGVDALGGCLSAGITPAHAGKRKRPKRWVRPPKDHPRVCGEKCDILGQLLGGLRITPACAGKRPGWADSGCQRGDHPRVCGEKLPSMSYSVVRFGSLPHMRGKEPSISRPAPASGSTPACAGKSSIQHLTASLGEFEVQKGHPVPHLRQRLQVWPDHARHLRHGLILHASRSAGQGRRLCPGPYPDTAGSGTPRGPSPAKRPHTSPPAATPGGCRAWQSGATAPGSR